MAAKLIRLGRKTHMATRFPEKQKVYLISGVRRINA